MGCLWLKILAFSHSLQNEYNLAASQFFPMWVQVIFSASPASFFSADVSKGPNSLNTSSHFQASGLCSRHSSIKNFPFNLENSNSSCKAWLMCQLLWKTFLTSSSLERIHFSSTLTWSPATYLHYHALQIPTSLLPLATVDSSTVQGLGAPPSQKSTCNFWLPTNLCIVPWYTWEIGSRTPTANKIYRCASPLLKCLYNNAYSWPSTSTDSLQQTKNFEGEAKGIPENPLSPSIMAEQADCKTGSNSPTCLCNVTLSPPTKRQSLFPHYLILGWPSDCFCQ